MPAYGRPTGHARCYLVALSTHTLGGIVKLVWLLAALLLTALTIGGVMAFARRHDPFDLAISALLGAGAVACWRRTSS